MYNPLNSNAEAFFNACIGIGRLHPDWFVYSADMGAANHIPAHSAHRHYEVRRTDPPVRHQHPSASAATAAGGVYVPQQCNQSHHLLLHSETIQGQLRQGVQVIGRQVSHVHIWLQESLHHTG